MRHIVGNQDYRLPRQLSPVKNGCQQFIRRLPVKSGSWFIKEENRGRTYQNKGANQTVALTSGKRTGIFAERGIHSLRQFFDNWGKLCRLQSKNDFLFAGSRLEARKVFPDGRREKETALRNGADEGAQGGTVIDASLCWLPKSG